MPPPSWRPCLCSSQMTAKLSRQWTWHGVVWCAAVALVVDKASTLQGIEPTDVSVARELRWTHRTLACCLALPPASPNINLWPSLFCDSGGKPQVRPALHFETGIHTSVYMAGM